MITYTNLSELKALSSFLKLYKETPSLNCLKEDAFRKFDFISSYHYFIWLRRFDHSTRHIIILCGLDVLTTHLSSSIINYLIKLSTSVT
ncbi:hypothetical protein [Klebsiella oxytoca]|uniref:hypothetical protein n=1 Tax=Klebsiella oxytoca TaxID=571 RepID=UPI003F692CB3